MRKKINVFTILFCFTRGVCSFQWIWLFFTSRFSHFHCNAMRKAIKTHKNLHTKQQNEHAPGRRVVMNTLTCSPSTCRISVNFCLLRLGQKILSSFCNTCLWENIMVKFQTSSAPPSSIKYNCVVIFLRQLSYLFMMQNIFS